jgi:hypothetical protein
VFKGDFKGALEAIAMVFENIFGGIGNTAKTVINTIISVINGMLAGLNNVTLPDWFPFGLGGKKIELGQIPSLSTGGEVTKEGMTYLHPSEVVVNAPLTRNLDSFLSDYGRQKTSSPASETVARTEDNRIIFEKESIVLRVMKVTPEELEKVAETIEKIIERRKQLRNMAVRTAPVPAR